MKVQDIFSDTRLKVIYGGRFQPPHKGHFAVYQWLVDHFGEDHVYIAMSDRTHPIKSPFNFEERKFLWTTGLSVSSKKVIHSKIPTFNPEEILSLNDIYVTVTSVKDQDRYHNKNYFVPYPTDTNGAPVSFKLVRDSLKPKEEHGYYIIAPTMERGLSGTKVRETYANEDIENRKKIIKTLYKKMNLDIFNLFNEKLIKKT